jgi:EpsI family protein
MYFRDSTPSLIRSNDQLGSLWFQAGLLAAAFLFAYSTTIPSFVRIWSGRDDYSHGFLVPFISLYFVWRKRESLRQLALLPNIPGGLILTSIGGFMLLMGSISSTVTAQQLSILVTIPGIVLLVFGSRYLIALSLPLMYLVFMVPDVLDIVISRMHWPFQLFSAIIAGKLMAIANIPVFQNAQYLELPNITLEVANSCSGVRYLISIIAISIPLAYFTQKSLVKRLLLIIFAVIIGILANPLRITLIGIWAYTGHQVTHGPLHIFQGLFVSVVGLVFLFLGMWILQRISSDGPRNRPLEHTVQKQYNEEKNRVNIAWGLSMVILLSIGAYLFHFRAVPLPLKTSLDDFPVTIEEWKGENLNEQKAPFPIQGADASLVMIYRNASGKEIKLQIAYFEAQQQDKKLISYSLNKFYENTEKLKILTASHEYIPVNKTVINNGLHHTVMLYWYDLNGDILANNTMAKVHIALDGLIKKQTNGALVVVSSDINKLDEMNTVLNDEKEFVQLILPLLRNYLPYPV